MSGFDALERAFQGVQYTLDDNTPARLSGQFDARRRPTSYRRPVPVTYADIPSSDDDETESLPSNRSSDRKVPRKTITPPQTSIGTAGFPPTPPTMSSSGVVGRPRVEAISPTPQFADAYRNALHSQKSTLSTPGAQLPTPEASPPATSEEFLPHSILQPPFLSRHPSSLHAESFHTARERASASQLHLPHTPSPGPPHVSKRDWITRTREQYLRPVQPTVTSASSTAPSRLRVYASSESDSSDSDDHGRNATPRRQRQSQPIHPQYNMLPVEDHFEKHISYGEGDFDSFEPPVGPEKPTMGVIPSPSEPSPANAEDVNNLIYRHIQEENVKRHSAVSDGSAMPVGIFLAASEPGEKRLKRTVRREALRADASNDAESHRYSEDVPLPLRYKKTVSSAGSAGASPGTHRAATGDPSASHHNERAIPKTMPEVGTDMGRHDLHARSVPSPTTRQHQLRRSHDVDRLERKSLEQRTVSDEGRSAPVNADNTLRASSSPKVGADHTLRRFSRNSHLENNRSVRRTSLDSRSRSPPAASGFTVSPLNPPKLRRSKELDVSSIAFEPLFPSSQQPADRDGRSRKLRHFTADARLENTAFASRGIDHQTVRDSLESASSQSQQASAGHPPLHTLRHFRAHTKLGGDTFWKGPSLEPNASSDHRTSTGSNGQLSSPRKSLSADPRFLYPSTTPFSTSQMSDRTEIEVCEAKGVNIYPHNNHSLLLVQHGHDSRPSSKDKALAPPPNFLRMTNSQIGIGQPLFSAYVEEPSPRLPSSSPTNHYDSPLTNPRTAPVPPALQIIPPTPVQELDCQLGMQHHDAVTGERKAIPQRRQSLLQRARRYSESFVQPLFGRSNSVRTARRSADDTEQRPTNLSPFWKPRNFWENFDSDEEAEDWDDDDYVYDEHELPPAILPLGGDTSDVLQEPKRKNSLLPRNMSVRMPGFRGNGGFLLGNSVGIDRHGSNNRRHHVSVESSSSLRKRQSEEMLRHMTSSSSLGRHRGRGFVLPFTVQYVGVRRFRERWSERKAVREEKQREKRRRVLRAQIQHAR